MFDKEQLSEIDEMFEDLSEIQQESVLDLVEQSLSHGDLTEDELMHYGVIGMKWGKRKRARMEKKLGDGRSSVSEDKIKESCIRPIYNDADLYTIKFAMNSSASNEAKEFIRSCIKSRDDYEGSGNPNLYTTEDVISDLLLIEDANGRFIYDSIATLARTLRVNQIIPVPVMKGLTRTDAEESKTYNVKAIIVNPNDYWVGADKGGQISMFDDFDIDYNQYKYLMETRISGSLVKPYSAIVIEKAQ